MSPEQVRGNDADVRSDIFSFGAVLYEMLSGKRAFQSATPADTMGAILTADIPDLSDGGRAIPAALDGIVRHCLEKNPQQRFQSAHDLAFHLEQLARGLSSSSSPAIAVAVKNKAWLWPLVGALSLVALGFAFFVGRQSNRSPRPIYRQVTFQRGQVFQARFSPDGQTIIYSAEWNGQPSDVFTTRTDHPGARSLDLKGGQVLAVSSAGNIAVLLKVREAGTFVSFLRAARRRQC